MRRRIPFVVVLLLTSLVSVFAFQTQQQTDPPKPSFAGKVVSVADGDTITVLFNNQQHRMRLEGAP